MVKFLALVCGLCASSWCCETERYDVVSKYLSSARADIDAFIQRLQAVQFLEDVSAKEAESRCGILVQESSFDNQSKRGLRNEELKIDKNLEKKQNLGLDVKTGRRGILRRDRKNVNQMPCTVDSKHVEDEAAPKKSVVFLQPNRKGYRPAHPLVLSHVNSRGKSLREKSESVLFKCEKNVRYIQKRVLNPKSGRRETLKRSLQANSSLPIQLKNMEVYPKSLIYNQGGLGSCTANSMAHIMRYLSVLNSDDPSNFISNPQRLDISRLYQYWHSRFLEASLTTDSIDDVSAATNDDRGASMAAGVLSTDVYGCCPEVADEAPIDIAVPDLRSVGTNVSKFKGWPYNERFYTQRPDPGCTRMAFDLDRDGINEGTAFSSTNKSRLSTNSYAKVSQAIRYEDIATSFRTTETGMSYALPQERASFCQKITASLRLNRPVYFGTLLDDTFMPDSLGRIPTPDYKKFSPTGGHAMVIVGYGAFFNAVNDTNNYFKLLNSWGSSVSGKGYLYMKEDYVLNPKVFQIEAYSVWLDSVIWNKKGL